MCERVSRSVGLSLCVCVCVCVCVFYRGYKPSIVQQLLVFFWDLSEVHSEENRESYQTTYSCV